MQDLFIKCWQSRICHYLTPFGLFIIFMQWCYPDIVHQFLGFIFLDVGEKVITKIVEDPTFTTIVMSALGGLLVILKKNN